MSTTFKATNTFLLVLLLFTTIVGCKDEELPTGGVSIEEGITLTWERKPDYHTIHVKTDHPWTIEVEGEWITPLQKEGEGKTELRVYVEQNSNDEDRQGKIRITPKGFKATEILIKQKGLNTTDNNDEMDMRNLVGMGYDIRSGFLDPKCIKAQIFNPEKGYDFARIAMFDTLTVTKNGWYDISYTIFYNSFNSNSYNSFETFFSEIDLDSINKKYKKTPQMLQYKIITQRNAYSIGAGGFSYQIQFPSFNNGFTSDFKNAIQKIIDNNYDKESVLELYNTFGTHAVYSEDLGGSIYYFMAANKELFNTPLKSDLGLFIGWKERFGLPLDDLELMIKSELGNNFNGTITVRGGDEQILSNAVAGGACTPQDLDLWKKSIQRNSQAINIKITSMEYLIKDYGVDEQRLSQALKLYRPY